MSWNEIFWWLAILTLSLAFAQLGISNLTPSFWKKVFRRMSDSRIREVMRVFQNFLGILSVIALFLALTAGLELITGLGRSLAVLIAKHFGYSDNAGMIGLIQIGLSLAITAFVLAVLWYLWKVAAKLPSRDQDTQEHTGTINAEIRQHFKETKEGNTKSKGK